MKVRFVGPLGTVTGSCTLLEHDGVEFLVDCGLEQDQLSQPGWNKAAWPFDPARLRFVILTHAHADHCGLIPALYRRGFKGVVYCTRETAQIAAIMLKDSARLSGGLYTEAEVDAIRWREPGKQVLGGYHPLAHDLFMQFFRTAHVLGSVAVRVLWGDRTQGQQKSIVFSGDLGPDIEDEEGLPFLRHRMAVPPSDFAVIESTYGSKTREPADQGLAPRQKRLQHLVDKVMLDNGTLVIPAFSLGRVQDLLFDLHWLVACEPERYAGLSLQLDAPLAQALAPVIARGLERAEPNGRGKVRPLWLGKQLFRWLGLDDTDPIDIDRAIDICRLTMGLPAEHPDAAARGSDIAKAWPRLLGSHAVTGQGRPFGGQGSGAKVVLATSGMGDHGRAAHWLKRLLRDPASIIAFSGYCAASSVGGKLQALMNLPATERRRLRADLSWSDGDAVPEREIQATLAVLPGYSGHADQAGLLAWAFSNYKEVISAAGRTVFIQHGNEQDRVALAQAISQRGRALGIAVDCVRPMANTCSYDLDAWGTATRAA